MVSNIQLINESFERRYLNEAEISPENKEDNAVFLRNIKECLSRLNEAEMSDEDKKDSAILWDIYNKTQKRANAKLTPEEKSVLDKYGLTRGQYKNIENTNDDVLPGRSPLVSRRIGHNAVLNGSDKINLADRARKINSRGTGYEHSLLRNGYDYAHEIDNHREYKDEKTGERKQLKDKGLLDRERESQTMAMSSDVKAMKKALERRNSAKSRLDNNDAKYDANRDAIQKAYERNLAWNEKRRQEDSDWAKRDLDTFNDKINTILNSKKKNESFYNKDDFEQDVELSNIINDPDFESKLKDKYENDIEFRKLVNRAIGRKDESLKESFSIVDLESGDSFGGYDSLDHARSKALQYCNLFHSNCAIVDDNYNVIAGYNEKGKEISLKSRKR